jgi:transposase InsO family protein
MCTVLEVSRQGFYAWWRRTPSQHRLDDQSLAARIKAIHAGSRGRYGSPRVHAQLRKEGVRVGRKRVERLMREQGLEARRKRKFRRTTDSNHDLPVAPNVLERDFETDGPNQVWVTDIERHEALPNLAVMKGHRRWLVAASRQKLRAA